MKLMIDLKRTTNRTKILLTQCPNLHQKKILSLFSIQIKKMPPRVTKLAAQKNKRNATQGVLNTFIDSTR